MQGKENSTLGNKTLKTKKRVAIIVIALALFLCTLSLGVVVAKYINSKDATDEVRAAEFYFTSNLLDKKEHTLAPGTTSVTFTLGNHPDDLRFSNVNIEYTVTVDNGAKVNNGATINSDATDNVKGTIAKGSVSDATVTISNLQAGKTYIIKAVGTGKYSQTLEGGFTKTLTATILIQNSNEKVYYKIDDSAEEYVLLTVWNEGESQGTVTVKYTGIPDNTNSDMTEWLAGSSENILSQNVTIGAHQSKVLRFFGGTVTVEHAELKAK